MLSQYTPSHPTGDHSSSGPTWRWWSSACGPTRSSQPRPGPTGVRDAIPSTVKCAPTSRHLRRGRLRPHLPSAARHTYLPLGTTAHKQGRIAGENALGGTREFAGSLGTQVVKTFDLVAARTGLRDHEAIAGGLEPLTVTSEADDHKAYYPGSRPITMRYTGDRANRAAPRRPTDRPHQLRDRQTHRHRRDRHPQPHDYRRNLRARPLLHPAPRLPLGRTPTRRPSMDPTVVQGRTARGLRSALTPGVTFDPCVPGASRSLENRG